MFSVHIDNIGEMAVVECEGRIVRSEAALKLRDAFNLQTDARIIVLDLSEVYDIAGGGLGMLVFLQRWAETHGIQMKLFNPRKTVRDRLRHAPANEDFDIVTIGEMMNLLAESDPKYAYGQYAHAA